MTAASSPSDGQTRRVLLDESVPHDLLTHLRDINAATVQAVGWAGGPHAYAQLLEILASPSHRDFREMTDWIGPGFQSDIFDLRATNRILALAFPAGAV